MGRNKKKHVPARALPTAGGVKKRPTTSASFRVSLRFFEDEGPACKWSDDGAGLVETLIFLGQKEGDSNAITPDNREHYQNIDGIIPEAIKWLTGRPALQDCTDLLWTFRKSGKHRVWGILIDDVFFLLWNDPEHKICPSRKR